MRNFSISNPHYPSMDMKIFVFQFLHWKFILYQIRIRNKINGYFTNFGQISPIFDKFFQFWLNFTKFWPYLTKFSQILSHALHLKIQIIQLVHPGTNCESGKTPTHHKVLTVMVSKINWMPPPR